MESCIIKERIKIIPNLLFFSQMGVVFISRLPQYEGVHFLYAQFVIALFSYIYIYKHHKKSIVFNSYMHILFVYSAWFIISFILIGNADIREVLNGIVLMPVIPLLLYFFRISNLFALLQFLIVTGYIIFVVTTGLVPLDEVTYNSGNFLSYYAMLYSFPYYVTCYYEKKEPLLIVPIITLIVALLSLGRGGIISSGLLLLLLVYFKINAPGRIKWLYRFLLVLLIVFVSYVGVSDSFSLFLDASLSKFDAYGMDTRGRSDSYTLYLASLTNPIYLLLGTPIEKIPYIYNYLEGHVHNSWLTLHSTIGIYSLFILLYVFTGLRYLLKNKQYYILAIMLCLLLAGFSNTDIAGALVGGDMYLFFIIIMYIEYKKHIVHGFYK